MFILNIFLIFQNVFNRSPLHIAVLSHNADIVQLLLSKKDIDVNSEMILIIFFYIILAFAINEILIFFVMKFYQFLIQFYVLIWIMFNTCLFLLYFKTFFNSDDMPLFGPDFNIIYKPEKNTDHPSYDI